MFVLGVSCFFHDAAAALLEDGALVAAAEEERFSRVKHDSSFPENAIAFCLAQRGIEARDLDYVVFFEKPLVKLDRLFSTIFATAPRSLGVFREATLAWFENKLWVKSLLKEKLEIGDDKLLFVDHHLAHAASAFLSSPFEDAAILTVDGVGEWTTTSLSRASTRRHENGESTTFQTLAEMRFPHSLGLLYSAFTAFLGFEVNEGEYKVMGMAPYGTPRYVEKVMQLIDLHDDGSFRADLSYFSYQHSTKETISARFEELFGARRDPQARFVTAQTSLYDDPDPPTREELEKNQYYADVAASIQRVTEEILLRMTRHLHKLSGAKNLCLAGGVALNSCANSRLLRETPFEKLFVQPAAGDSGGALGAALYASNVLLGKPRNFAMRHAAWGREYSRDETAAFLREENIAHRAFDDEEKLLQSVARLLESGRVIGWHQGRFEWGPRALGQRSILADPRRAAMKDNINIKIKFREPFRPFAPSVLAECAADYFEVAAEDASDDATRFMLMVTPVRPDARELLPATTHVDNTARLQTVHADCSPRYHRLISTFGAQGGVPVVLNTSFNLRGEPIVNTPREAFQTFCNSGLDALVLGDHLILKEGEVP